ncbi:MAG TPA: CGNR zinc finger domain-containing protein, partial [Propionibacteriaceae bacterium]|nr:CGNR zinc finger domain-containing protein [Propionibacteriaceae bacterium]
VLTWAQQVDLISNQEEAELQAFVAAEPRWAAAEFDQFVRMREAAYAALVDDSVIAVDELVVTSREALQRARLTKAGGRWEWSEPTLTLTTPRDRAVRQVIDLLTSADLALLHQCEDRACGWVYLDTSPRHNRRWCVAADCGNRNRARRFYARQRTGS